MEDRMSPFVMGCSMVIAGLAIILRIIAWPAAFAVVIWMLIGVARGAEPYHSNPWLLSWIPATCCVTNDCCWEISESELRALPDDHYEVRATGQVRKRTDWSPDGKTYRCACDHDKDSNSWVRHQGANTRCLFVPMRSATYQPR
jgi:hypothetical protein